MTISLKQQFRCFEIDYFNFDTKYFRLMITKSTFPWVGNTRVVILWRLHFDPNIGYHHTHFYLPF